MQIFDLSKKVPVEERYSLTDQIRSSSRSVCANMAKAGRKRRYEAAFVPPTPPTPPLPHSPHSPTPPLPHSPTPPHV
jgi:hypothetical protein